MTSIPTCSICDREIQETQVIRVIQPALRLLRGKKSGHLYWEKLAEKEEPEIVHVACIAQRFNIEDNPTMWDDLYEDFNYKLWDEALEAAWNKVDKVKENLCAGCRVKLDDGEDLP